MSYELEIMRTMARYRWKRVFAAEYVMARQIHGLGHDGAVRLAKKSRFVRKSDLPAGI